MVAIPKRDRLLTISDLPPWMRDNDYLVGSYRPPLRSIRACLRTAFLTLNNETVNVWTHFIGFLLFLGLTCYCLGPLPDITSTLSTPPLCPAPPPPPHPSTPNPLSPTSLLSSLRFSGLSNACITSAFPYAFSQLIASHKAALLPLLLAATFCMAFSTTFHACWIYSPTACKLLSKLDFVGISLLCCGHAITGIFHLFYCRPRTAYTYYVLVLLFEMAALFAIFSPSFEGPGARHVRAAVFCGLGASGLFPLLHAGLLHSWTDDKFLVLLGSAAASIFVYFFGAVIYVVRFPECCRVGHHDRWGASHQIMHIAVIAGCWIHFAGIYRLVQYRLDVGCSLSPLLS